MPFETNLPGASPGARWLPPLDEFRAAGLLEGLGDEDAQRLIAALRPTVERFLDGQYLCRSGDVAAAFWIVRNGQVRIEDLSNCGGLEFLRSRGPGDVLGEVGYLASDKCRSASIRATGPVEVYEIQYARLDDIVDARLQSSLFRSLTRFAADKFGQANKHRAQLTEANIALTQLAQRFVPQYGLSALDTAAVGLRPEYQRETVVILFSDVAGFSEIAAGLSPDDTAALMKRVLDAQAKAIGDRHGEIDKFIGDAVMAFWVVHGDAAWLRKRACVHALNAALEAVAEVAKIENPLDGSPLQIRIGMHIGSAHSGNFGGTDRWAFTLIGHDVNIAARAEQARHADITDGHRQLGSVRATAAFKNCLPFQEQEKLPHQSDVMVKHTKLAIFSSATLERTSA